MHSCLICFGTCLLISSSTAMEKRNAIFKEAVSILKRRYGEEQEEVIDKVVLKRLPISYSTYNSKGGNAKEDEHHGRSKRSDDLPAPCHGFPLQLPAHVMPCKDGVSVTCGLLDNFVRRYCQNVPILTTL